jgi:hypothetical protein
VTTGWPQVTKTCSTKLGITFDDWQEGAGRLILAKRADGKLAAMIGGVGMSLPRQVGKTYLVGGMVFALCVDRPGMLVIWSAHHARTHTETFLAMQGFAKRLKVAPYIDKVYTGSGDEEIRFHNGSRILFGARERGFGRGIPGVDLIMSDEAQIMSDKALDAQLATMNTSQFGLAIFVGTPPRPDDPSEAFTRMRSEAWAGTLQDAAWIEFGADPGVNIHDRKAWAVANPSYPKRTPVESILRLQRKLKPDSFLREGLGVWDDVSGAAIFGPGRWEACVNADRPEGLVPGAFAVAVSYDQSQAAIAAAAVDADGLLWLRPLEHGPGIAWLVESAVRLQKTRDVDVVLDGRGPAVSLLPDFMKAGVRVKVASTADVLDAYDRTYQAVTTGMARHPGNPVLDKQVGSAVPRAVGDRFALGRKASVSDISLFEAVELAAGAALAPAPVLEPWGIFR